MSDAPELTDAGIYEQLARVGKALSNPVRLRILDLLEQGELTVDEVASAAQQPMKNTSAQLQVLRAAQLVHARRDGNRVHYRVADPRVSRFLGGFQSFAEHTLAELQIELDQLSRNPGGMQRISVDDLEERLSDPGTVIVDVRSAADYARGHVPGSISIPLPELGDRLDEIAAATDVIAYCEGPYCFACGDAVAVLLDAGRNACRVDGGLTRWVRAGGELEHS